MTDTVTTSPDADSSLWVPPTPTGSTSVRPLSNPANPVGPESDAESPTRAASPRSAIEAPPKPPAPARKPSPRSPGAVPIDPVPPEGTDPRPTPESIEETRRHLPIGPSIDRSSLPRRGELPVLEKTRCPKLARTAARWLMGGLGLTVLLMMFSPWQQTVKGSGNVTNFDPKLRPQTVEAPIAGRVVRLGEGIREMTFVNKGDLIVELSDLDPERLSRIRNQKLQLEQTLQSARDSLEFARAELERVESNVPVYQANVESLTRAREQSIAAAESELRVARDTRDSTAQLVNQQTAILSQTQADFDRQRTLYREGITAERRFQEAEQKYNSARAQLEKSKADLNAAEKRIAVKQSDLETVREKTQADIEIAQSRVQSAEASVEASRAKVASAEQAVQRAQVALTDIESNVRRQENQQVLAPIDGYLVEIYTDAGASVVSLGEPIARIVPQTEDRIVQIWLDGNDATLVEPGRHVRLQFEGWPAVQFAGWPSVAVGTFGGDVVSVDATDDGNGRFRMLVREVSGTDPKTGLTEEPWPQGKWLRPGVRANAWVLLETVPLWWEVWRNLNGFPPVVDTEGARKKPKTPKLPKS